jgi:ribonuclease HI
MGASCVVLGKLDDMEQKIKDQTPLNIADYPHNEYGSLTGFASSTKAELTAIYQLLQKIPYDQDIHIRTDSASVKLQFEVQSTRIIFHKNDQQRATYRQLWSAIRAIMDKRTGSTTIQWVKGHGDDQGNHLADILAGRHGEKSDDNTQKYHSPTMQDRKEYATLCFGDTEVEIDARKWLKYQFQAINNRRLLEIKWIQENINPTETGGQNRINWPETIQIWNAGTKPSSRYIRDSISSWRSYCAKIATGTLPTLKQMKRRLPHIYITDKCPICNEQATEDQDHVFLCHSRRRTLRKIIQEFKLEILLLVQQTRVGMFTFQKQTAVLNEWIENSLNPDYHMNPLRKDKLEVELMSFPILLILFGVVPAALYDWILSLSPHKIENWAASISRAIADATVKARTNIWLERCSEIVEWEKEKNITQGQKRGKSNTASQEENEPKRRARTKKVNKQQDAKTSRREEATKGGELVLLHHQGIQELPAILNSKKKVADCKTTKNAIVGEEDRKMSKRQKQQIKALRQQIRERRPAPSDSHEDQEELPPTFDGEAFDSDNRYIDPNLKLIDAYLESCDQAENEFEAKQQTTSPSVPQSQTKRRGSTGNEHSEQNGENQKKRRIDRPQYDENTMDRSGVG